MSVFHFALSQVFFIRFFLWNMIKYIETIRHSSKCWPNSEWKSGKTVNKYQKSDLFLFRRLFCYPHPGITLRILAINFQTKSRKCVQTKAKSVWAKDFSIWTLKCISENGLRFTQLCIRASSAVQYSITLWMPTKMDNALKPKYFISACSKRIVVTLSMFPQIHRILKLKALYFKSLSPYRTGRHKPYTWFNGPGTLRQSVKAIQTYIGGIS